MVMSFENYNKRQWEKIPENNGRLNMNEVASKEIVNREAREILRSIGCGNEEITRTIAECNGDTSKIQKAIDRIMDSKVVNEENNWETVQSRRAKKANEKNNKKNQIPQKPYGKNSRVFSKPYGRGAGEYSMRDREGGKPFSMNNKTIGNVVYGNQKENPTTTGGQQPNKTTNNMHASNNGGGSSGSGGGIKKASETRTGLVVEKETKHVEEHIKNEQTERQSFNGKGKENKSSKKKEKEASEEDKKDSTDKRKESIDKKISNASKEVTHNKLKDGTNKISKMDSSNSKPIEEKEETVGNKKSTANLSNLNNYNNSTNSPNKKEYRSNDDHSKKDLKGKRIHVSSGTNVGSFTRSSAYPNGDKYYRGYNKFGSRGINEGSVTRGGKPRFNGINNRIGLYNSSSIFLTNYSKGVAKKIYGNKKLNKRKRFVNKNDSDNEYDIYTGMKLNYDLPYKEKEKEGEMEKEKEKEKKMEGKKTEPKITTPKNKTQATSYASVVNNSAKIVTEVESKKCDLSESKEKEKRKNKCQLIPMNNNNNKTEGLVGDKKIKEVEEGTKEENTNDHTKTEHKKGTNKTAKAKKKKEGTVDTETKEQMILKNKDAVHKNETTEVEKGTISYSSMVKKGSELSNTRCKVIDKVSTKEEINNVEETKGEELKETVYIDKEIEKREIFEEKETEEKKTGEIMELTNTECQTKEQEEQEQKQEESKKKEKKKKKKIEVEKKDAIMEKEKKSKAKKKKSHSEDSKKGSIKGTKGINLENHDSWEEDLIKKGPAIKNNVVDDKMKNATGGTTVPMFVTNTFSPLSLEGQLFFGNICISNNRVDEIGKRKQNPMVHDVIEPNRKNKISRENIKDHDRMIHMNLLNENANISIADVEQPSSKFKQNQRIEEDVIINPEETTRDGNRRMKNIYNNNNNNNNNSNNTRVGGGGHKEHMNRMNSINNSMEYKNRRGNKRGGDDYEDKTPSYNDNKQKFLFSNKNLPMNTKINTSSIHCHMESYLGHQNLQSHRHNKNNKNNTVVNDLHGSSNASNKHFLHSSPIYANQVVASPQATTSAVVMNVKHKYEQQGKNKNYEDELAQEEVQEEQEHDSGSVEMNVMSQKVLGSHHPDVVASPAELENAMNNANTNNIGTNINALNNINTMNNMRNMTNMNTMNNMNTAMSNKNTNADVNNMNLINMNMNNMNNNSMYSSYNAPPGLANQFNYSFANLSYPYNNMHYNGYNAAQAMVPQYGLINNHYNKNSSIPPNNNFNYNLNYEGFEENSLYAHNNNMHMNNYVNFVNVGMKKNQMNVEEDNMSNSGDVSISGSLNPMGAMNNGDHPTNVNKNIHVMNACVDTSNANGMNVSLSAMNNHVNPNLNLSYIDMKNKHVSNKNNGTETQVPGGPMNQQVSIHYLQQSQQIHLQRKGTHSAIDSNNANTANVNHSRNSTQQNKVGTSSSGGINQFPKNQVHPNHSHRNTSASMESEEVKTDEGNGNPNGNNVNNTTSTTGPNVNKNEKTNEEKMADIENTNKNTNANVIGAATTTSAPGISEVQNQYVNKQLYHNDNYYNVNSTNFNVPPGFSVAQEKEPNNNYLNNAITRNNANNAVSAYRNNWNDMNEKNMNHYNVSYNYNRGNKNGYNYSNNMNYNNANTYNGNRENANNFYSYNNYNYALQTPPGLQNFYQSTQYQQQSNYNNRNYNYSAYNNNLSMWNREKQ